MKVLFCVFLLSLALFGDSFKFGMQIRIPNKFDPKKLPEYNLMSCCRPNFQDINDWDDIVPDEISDFGYSANDKVFIREMGKKGVLRYQTQYGTWVVEVFHDSHMSDSDFIEMEEDDFYHISNKKFKSHHWDGEKKSPKDNNDLKSMIANLQAEVQALRKGIEFQSRWQERAENLEVELYRSQFYERLILGVLAYHMDRLNDARLCFMLADSMSYRDRVSDAIINEYYNKLENKISENSTSTNSLLEGAPVKENEMISAMIDAVRNGTETDPASGIRNFAAKNGFEILEIFRDPLKFFSRDSTSSNTTSAATSSNSTISSAHNETMPHFAGGVMVVV